MNETTLTANEIMEIIRYRIEIESDRAKRARNTHPSFATMRHVQGKGDALRELLVHIHAIERRKERQEEDDAPKEVS